MSDAMLAQILELERLGREELKERWRVLYGTEPPQYSRDLLAGRLAYRLQELAYGGLAEAAKARLDACLPDDERDTGAARDARARRRRRKSGTPVAGTRLVREWQGRRYEVTAVEGGFEFEGRRYRSLTAVTKVITGTHWNGPAFFGLRQPERKGEG